MHLRFCKVSLCLGWCRFSDRMFLGVSPTCPGDFLDHLRGERTFLDPLRSRPFLDPLRSWLPAGISLFFFSRIARNIQLVASVRLLLLLGMCSRHIRVGVHGRFCWIDTGTRSSRSLAVVRDAVPLFSWCSALRKFVKRQVVRRLHAQVGISNFICPIFDQHAVACFRVALLR